MNVLEHPVAPALMLVGAALALVGAARWVQLVDESHDIEPDPVE